MIQNSVSDFKKDEHLFQDDFWDNYLDKQLKHLVIEYLFDFERIALALKNMRYKNSENTINREKCQLRWSFLHAERKKKQETNRKMPEETNEQKFNKLMSQPEKHEDFNIFENKPDLLNVPSGFNIFKDSIRGSKEKELAKEKENNFLRNLDNILLDDEESKIDKPLLFKAEFLDDKSICFTKEILSKEKADEILSKKIDWSKVSKDHNQQENPEFSKNINNVLVETENDGANPEEKTKAVLKEKEVNLDQIKTDEKEIKEENVEPKDDLLEKFKKIEEGFFTIEDVVEDLNKMNKEINQNIIPSDIINSTKIEKNLETKIERKTETQIESKIKTPEETKFDIKNENVISNDLKNEIELNAENNHNDKSDIFSLKQILIIKEIENFTEKKPEATNIEIKTVKFAEEIRQEISSDESAEEEDYLESQRLHIKSGSDGIIPIINGGKTQKRQKKPKKPKENKEDLNNPNEMPMIEQMIQEKQKAKKIQEKDEKKEIEFAAGEKFKNQLILEEIERKKHAEKQKDIEEMKRLQDKFKNDIEDNKRKKKEKKRKEMEEQAIHIAKQKKSIEQQQKEIDVKRLKALEEYKKEEETIDKKNQIHDRMIEVFNMIKTFNSKTSLGSIFEKNIAVMKHISSIPEDVFALVKDYKSYEISRFGITKRYQILIFPCLDDEMFLSEFLSYFMKNSCFSQESLPKIKGNHFAFHLLALHISAYTPAISDEENELFCFSSYLQNCHEFFRQVDANNVKRYIYMFFDTYIGEGAHILGDVVLDVKVLNNVLSERCVKSLKSQHIYDFDDTITLKKFAIKHLKTMKVAPKLFKEFTTFHAVSLKNNITFDEKFLKSQEVGLIFMKVFAKNKVYLENPEKPESVLQYLLKRTLKKGLDFIGMKTVYFNQENYQEFIQTFEKSKFFAKNVPFIVLGFAGLEAVTKLEKIIGSNDIFLAKKCDAKSINALYFEKREDTIHYFLNKHLNRKLMSYFFGGRLVNYNKEIFERIIYESKIQKRFTLFPDTIEYFPLFQIVIQPIQRHLVILSPIFQDISQIIQLIQKYGFIIRIIKTISAKNLFKSTLEEEKNEGELTKFLNEENLDKFSFVYEEENRSYQSIFFIIEGPNIGFLRKKLLKKVILHKKDFYPPKNQLFYQTNSKKNVELLEKTLQNPIKTHHPNFTKCISVPHFLAIWLLNENQTDLLHIAKDLEFLKAQNFELIGTNFNSQKENLKNNHISTILKEELSKNFKFSSFVKKKSEYNRFLEYFTAFILESKKFVCAFRFQGSDEEMVSSQIFENKIFSNSIQKCSDSLIYTLANKKTIGNKLTENEMEYMSHIFLQNFDIVFIKTDLDKLLGFSYEMSLELNDDTSIIDSVVNDFDHKSINPGDEFTKSFLIMSDNSIKTLSFYGILKKLENENFHLEFLSKLNLNQFPDVIDCFWKNIKNFINSTLKKQGKDIDNIKIEREKNEIMMKFLNTMNNTVWVFILNSENPVYKCKKLANFLVKNLDILRNNQKNEKNPEKIEFLKTKKLQLDYGIYCPLNFEKNLEEIDLLEKHLYSSPELSQKSQSFSSSTQPSNCNIICYLIKINTKESSKEMSQILQNLNQYKIKILDIKISSNVDFKHRIYASLEFFNQNFTQNSFNLYWNNNSEGLVCVLLADCSDLLSLNELFGSYKFDAYGQIIRIDKGKLMVIDENHFAIYAQKEEKIFAIKEKIFN